MAKPKFEGADAFIYVEESYPEKTGVSLLEHLRKHTHLPTKKEEFPVMTIFFGPGRSCSTAWALLSASNPYCVGAAYQPIKSQARHGPKYGDIYVPSLNGGMEYAVETGQPFWFMAKEVAGPFHAWENLEPGTEAIDPFYLWTKLGYPQEKINAVALVRDPTEVYISNFKFEGGIEAELLASNYQGILELYQKYKQHFSITPFVYDLCGQYTAETMVEAIMHKIGIPYVGLDFDLPAISEKLQLFEAKEPAEYNEIVAPTLAQVRFGYSGKRSKIPEAHNETINARIKFIEAHCGPIYKYFLNESSQILGF